MLSRHVLIDFMIVGFHGHGLNILGDEKYLKFIFGFRKVLRKEKTTLMFGFIMENTKENLI